MSANKITLTKKDESVLFTFADSDHYLTGNGTIEVPLNSLSLVIDSSDMVTFRKAASNDIFVSAPISYFGMTKAELEEWYADNMVGGTGGGIDPETLAELVSSAEYVSSSSTIDFKNVDGDVISTINAEPFITDGMVDNVQISGTNLVITFNIDAGKQPISIPLSSIFNPENYYDKTAIDNMLANKADVSAVTVDEYTIYATRNNSISTSYTSTPITWLKFTPFATGASTTGNLQFSGITGYLTLNNIDYANGTYAVAPNSQVQPSAVSGLSITFEGGNMIVEVDGSNPITYASITNTVIEYVKEVIPQKVASDAVYDNLYPLIKKVDDSLTSVTINSASTTQNTISLRIRNNGNTTITNPYINLSGYLTYSGTTLKAEAYVDTGTETLTTVAPIINTSSRTDYFFIDNVGQRTEANHMEIQILASDTINLDFYGYSINGGERSVRLTVGNGTVTSGYNWPSEATYSLSDGVLTIDYAFTGTAQTTPVSIYHIMATNQYGSTASVSDIVGYVKALLKDKVEVTEYIDNTLKPTIGDIEDSLSGKADTSAVTAIADSLSGKQDTLLFYTEDDNTQDGSKDAKIETTIEDAENGVLRTAYIRSNVNVEDDTYPFFGLYASTEVNNSGEINLKSAEVYASSEEGVNLYYQTQDDNQGASYSASLNLGGDGLSLGVGNVVINDNEETDYNASLYINTDGLSLSVNRNIEGEFVSFNVTYEGVTINDDAVVTESALSGKQDTLIAGSGITISGNVISADGGSGGGATYSAGTNISIDTANTINCTLPITANTIGSLVLGKNSNDTPYAARALAGGEGCIASGTDSFAFGIANTASSTGATAFGMKTRATVSNSFAIGKWNDMSDANTGEAFGSSGNTLFAVGNGWKQNDWTAGNASYHNALEIRQNGDIYFADTDNTTYQNFYEKPMIRLQDVTASLGGLKFVKCTQAEYDALAEKDPMTIYFIGNVVNNNS